MGTYEADLASTERDVYNLCKGSNLNFLNNEKGNVKYVAGFVIFFAFLYFLKCSNELSMSEVMWWGLVLIVCIGGLLYCSKREGNIYSPSRSVI